MKSDTKNSHNYRNRSKNNQFFEKTLVLITTFFSITIFFSDLQANPAGGVVVHGDAVITSPQENHVVIQQNSQKAIINWNSFNINANETTHFQQVPGGVALNRISPTQGASSIYGNLTATGKIILINPAGIYFGPGAYVNVGGMIATTANISNDNFINNRYYFEAAGNGQIINHGTLIAKQHGLIALVGNHVENNGMIHAHLGSVILGSAEAYTLNFGNDGLVNFVVNTKNKSSSTVTNRGEIYADGGRVLLTTAAVKSVLDNVINMDGMIQANTVNVHQGEIILSADKVNVTGKIYAKGKNAQESGGSVKIYSREFLLSEGAVIDASGIGNGGNIFIGNKNQDINLGAFNEKTIIAKDSQILANSDVSGNGGSILIWSDGLTDFYGHVSARGGMESGDGGFIEISGKENLNYQGSVDTTAAKGKMGTLLLDPKFIIITTLGLAYLDNINNRFNNSSSGTTSLTPASITVISATANIILQANSDVIFNDALALLGSATLTVQAGRSILINANVSTSNAAINMTANDSSAISAQRSTTTSGNPSGDTETVNGNIIMSSGTSLNAGNAAINLIVSDTGANPFTAGSATLESLTGGNITVTSANNITVNGAINGTTATLRAKTGSLTLNNSITTSGSNYSLVLAGNTFINNVGASVLTPTNGNFQVWSGSPLTDTRGGIAYNFKQYNATYGVTSVLGTGNGFLYTLAPTITPSLTGTVSKVYDTTTTATLAANNYSSNGAVDGDTVTLNNPSSGTYNNKNVGTGKNVAVTGIEISSATNGSATVYGYQVVTTANANVGTITAAPLTTSLTGTVSKVYDATTAATIAAGNYLLSGVLGSDSVSLNNPSSGTYDNKNVGTGKLVSVTGLSISGTDSGNYQLSSTSVNGNVGEITPATLTTSLTGTVSKIYDATTAAAIAVGNYVLSGVLGSDDVALNNPAAGTYDNKNVGTNKLVSVTGLAISGDDSANYQLSSTSVNGNVGEITPATLTTSLTGTVSKIYDTTTSAILAAGNYILSGVIGSDDVALNNPSSGTYDNKNVGTNKLVSVTGLNISGDDSANYQLSSTSVNGNVGEITPATLTTSLTGTVSKIYDATTAAAIAAGNYVLSGVIGSDDVALNNPAAGTYDNKNVGTNKLVSVAGLAISGDDSGNYQLSSTSVNGNIGEITPATLTTSLTGTVSKIYDATTAAAIAAGNYILSGVIGSDDVSLNNPAPGTYDTKNVGTNKLVSVTGLAISGEDSGNYQLNSTSVNGNVGEITPAILTTSLTGTVSKVYNATTSAVLSSGNYILSGVIGSDDVLLGNATSGTYDTKNIGVSKLVSVNGITLTGTDAGNYQLNTTSLNANIGEITVATLTPSLTGIVTKVYNGNTNASLTPQNYLMSGVYGSDSVQMNDPVSGQYQTANVGSNILVTVNGLSVSGADSGNYQLITTSISGNIGLITPDNPVNPPAPSNTTTTNTPVEVPYGAVMPIQPATNTSGVINPLSITGKIPVNYSLENIIFSEKLNPGVKVKQVETNITPHPIFNEIFANAIQPFNPYIPVLQVPAIVTRDHLIPVSLILIAGLGLVYMNITNRRKKNYMNEISFKLRTELETIMGFTMLLYENKMGVLVKEQRELLKDILDGTKQLMLELNQLEQENNFNAKNAFNIRIALQDIMGFSDIIRKKATNLTREQREMFEGILMGSSDILKLIPR